MRTLAIDTPHIASRLRHVPLSFFAVVMGLIGSGLQLLGVRVLPLLARTGLAMAPHQVCVEERRLARACVGRACPTPDQPDRARRRHAFSASTAANSTPASAKHSASSAADSACVRKTGCSTGT